MAVGDVVAQGGLELVYTGRRLSDVKAHLANLSEQGYWEVWQPRRVSEVERTQVLDDGSVDSVVFEDVLDQVFDMDGNVTADHSGEREIAVHLVPIDRDGSLRIEDEQPNS
jgi:hypothetical protein